MTISTISKGWLLASGGALALCADIATAQTLAPRTPDSVQIEEIVVTAERRSVSVQDIPIAVAAFTGDTLKSAGVVSPTDLNKLVSGLDFRSNLGSGVSLFIRGIGAQPLNGLVDQANAFSVDGVFFSRSNGPDTTFFDLERVEVLKGPQGTLYGRNATAGAVNVITNRPKLGQTSADLSVTGGDYGTYQVEGSANAPLGKSAALRLAVNLAGHDGYFDDGYNDQKSRAGRLRLLIEPNADTNLTISLDGAQQRGMGTGFIPIGPNAAEGMSGRFVGDPWAGPSSAAIDSFVRARAATLSPTGFPPPLPAFAPRSLTADGADADARVHNDIWGLSGTFSTRLSFADWTTVAGFRDIKTDGKSYTRWDSLYSRFHSKETTAETRLSSRTDQDTRLDWIVGAFYGKEDQYNAAWTETPTPAPANPSFAPDADFIYFYAPDIASTSWAVFGQSTVKLTPTARFTAGARYTEDRKKMGVGVQGYVDEPYDTTAFPSRVVNPFVTIPGGFSPLGGARKFDAVTYTLGLEYDAAADNLLYFNIRKGYHAGGLIQGDAVGPNPTDYEPERLMAYALGSKNRFADGALQLNAEFYYWDYKDLQIAGLGLVNCGTCTANAAIPVAQSTLAPTVTNAGRAKTWGLDLDGVWRATARDTLTVNMLVAHGEYEDYDTTSASGAPISGDGNRMANLPKLTATVSYQHRFDLAGGALTAGVRSRYVSQRHLSAIVYPGSVQPSYHQTDLEVTWAPAQSGVRLTGFVHNLEDKAVVASAYDTPEVTTGVLWGTLYPPRTYGATLSLSF
jgi:iron complex outermembrane receptor protein